MSRFSDDECSCPYQYGCENTCRVYEFAWANYKRALDGRRGQKFLAEFIAALHALPQRRLIAGATCAEGEVCAIGAWAAYKSVQAGKAAGMAEAIYQLEAQEPGWRDEHGHVRAGEFGDYKDYYDLEDQRTADIGVRSGMVRVLALEVANHNDESWTGSPEQRWEQALQWAEGALHGNV